MNNDTPATQMPALAKSKMSKQVEFFKNELASIRAGRANPALVTGIKVDYYGTQTPIEHMASVSAPEARLLVIEPWDKNALPEIEKAIMKADLGIMPSNDGDVIRLSIPQLTEERRKELVSMASKKAEESRVSVRNIRRETNDAIKEAERDGELSEDDAHRLLDEVQEITDEHIERVDELLKEKEEDIMEV